MIVGARIKGQLVSRRRRSRLPSRSPHPWWQESQSLADESVITAPGHTGSRMLERHLAARARDRRFALGPRLEKRKSAGGPRSHENRHGAGDDARLVVPRCSLKQNRLESPGHKERRQQLPSGWWRADRRDAPGRPARARQRLASRTASACRVSRKALVPPARISDSLGAQQLRETCAASGAPFWPAKVGVAELLLKARHRACRGRNSNSRACPARGTATSSSLKRSSNELGPQEKSRSYRIVTRTAPHRHISARGNASSTGQIEGCKL